MRVDDAQLLVALLGLGAADADVEAHVGEAGAHGLVTIEVMALIIGVWPA